VEAAEKRLAEADDKLEKLAARIAAQEAALTSGVTLETVKV
jgi:hypothetical protein